MLRSFNRVIIVGNLARNPKFQTLSNGQSLADMTLAVNDRRQIQDGQLTEATFVNITCWGRLAELVDKKCLAGSRVLVEGRLGMDTLQVGGTRSHKLRVIVETIEFLD